MLILGQCNCLLRYSYHLSPDLEHWEFSSRLQLVISHTVRVLRQSTVCLIDSSSHIEIWCIYSNMQRKATGNIKETKTQTGTETQKEGTTDEQSYR